MMHYLIKRRTPILLGLALTLLLFWIQVGGAGWNQLWDQYIAEPCELELARFGNNSATLGPEWDGSIDSLVGLDNPEIGGGMASNLDDYAKLLSLQLNDGACGENQVLSPEAVSCHTT